MIIDRALRARPKDDGLKGLVVRFLATGATDSNLFVPIREAAEEVRRMEDEARRIARGYEVEGGIAVVDARGAKSFDKTYLLLLGQERARISVVHDDTTVTAAAPFDSGVDLLSLLGLDGGMPTRVSLPRERLDHVLDRLRAVP
jgi:hypothetical protein